MTKEKSGKRKQRSKVKGEEKDNRQEKVWYISVLLVSNFYLNIKKYLLLKNNIWINFGLQ